MIIRVRTNVGVWRVENLESTSKIGDILQKIKNVRPDVVFEKPLSMDPTCAMPFEDESRTLESHGLVHGSMVHCRVDPGTCMEGGSHKKKIIAQDGSIKSAPTDVIHNANGFREGMLALRDIKKHWTLNEFMALDAKYVFKIRRQTESWIASSSKTKDGSSSAPPPGLSIERGAAVDFQNCVSVYQFQRSRYGYLYGTTEEVESANTTDEEDKDHQPKYRVKVEAIYEPPQEADPSSLEGFIMLEDPMEDTVEQLAQRLGWKKVGWILGHAPREKGFTFSAAEIIMAAEFQLEAADGVKPTPFVTVAVTQKDNSVSFEAYQISKQCMEMVAEGALEIDEDDPKVCRVNNTFTALQESKESKTVENDFFLTLVPIAQHVSETFVRQFPAANRETEVPSADALKKQLSQSGKNGWEFVDLLSDFHLLLYLSQFLSEGDMENICKSVVDRSLPLPDGYKIIITTMAGMDGSY